MSRPIQDKVRKSVEKVGKFFKIKMEIDEDDIDEDVKHKLNIIVRRSNASDIVKKLAVSKVGKPQCTSITIVVLAVL